MTTKDSLWKSAIEDFFADLMAFFYPEAVDGLDLSRIEFLDQELQQLFPDSGETTRYVDKLIKVPRHAGPDLWLLVHIEVQGYADPSFGARMFRYYYRIYDRYGLPIEALALLLRQPARLPARLLRGHSLTDPAQLCLSQLQAPRPRPRGAGGRPQPLCLGAVDGPRKPARRQALRRVADRTEAPALS